MIHIKLYEDFVNSYGKIYTNIKNQEGDDFYQVPFYFLNEERCFGEDYKLCFSQEIYYADIATDEKIEQYLNQDLSEINVNSSWTKNTSDIFAKTNPDFHAYRIAKLVKELEANRALTPVLLSFDERSYEFLPNYIEDGNHRIRALQYLGYDYFPAYVYGSHASYLIKALQQKGW